MSANVEFNITAFDEASSVFSDVSNSANQCFSTIESGASEAATNVDTSFGSVSDSLSGVTSAAEQVNSSVDESMSGVESSISGAQSAVTDLGTSFEEADSQMTASMSDAQTSAASLADQTTVNTSVTQGMTDSVETSTGSLKTNALAASQAASSAATLVMSVSNVENAQVSVDRANLQVTKSTDALTAAHITAQKAVISVQTAQTALNDAITKYGATSPQAELAQEKLSAAQETADLDNQKLSASQDALTVAQERAKEANRNLQNDYMMMAVSVVPTVISGITALSTLTAAWPAVAGAASGATEALSVAMDFLAANPIVLVIAGVVALALGLYEAYEHCKPFRDAINEVGAVLGGAVKAAFTAVSDVVNFLWSDVFKPFGEFLVNTFVNLYLKPLQAAWNDISSALQWVWHNVLEPVADFFKGVLAEAINFVMAPINAFESAISKVGSLLKPITGLIGDLTGALKSMCFAHAAPAAEEFNKQLTAGIENSNSLTQKLDPLKQGLLGVVGSAGSSSGVSGSANLGQQQNMTQQELTLETKNLTAAITKLNNNVQRGGSANQSVAASMQRRF